MDVKIILTNSSTTKISKHIPSGFFNVYTVEIVNFKKKKMKLLSGDQQESHENAKICHICKAKFANKYLKDTYCKV